MDEFNNDRNPFDEEKQSTPNPYAEQQDPYNQQSQNPYNQQPQDPYSQQPQQNPYQQQQQPQNPYQQQQNPYNQPQNPYNQQPQNPYNQQPQNPYYQQPQAYGGYQLYPQRQSTGMAMASLVLGIISIVGAPFSMFIIPLIIPLIGLILGIVYKTKHYSVGRGLSTAGIITSAIGLVLPFVLIVVMIAAMPAMIEYIRQTSPEEYKQLYDMYSEQFPQWFSEAAIFIKNLF